MKKLIFCMFACTLLAPSFVYAKRAEPPAKQAAAGAELADKVNGKLRQREQFFEAVRKGDAVTVRQLAEKRVDVNMRGKDGKTALMAASGAPMLRVLLEVGADVNLRDDAGNTALIYFCRQPNALEAVRVLLEAGADINVRNEAGESALDVTSDPQVEKLLVAAGAL